jgi:outer membrane protein TolC
MRSVWILAALAAPLASAGPPRTMPLSLAQAVEIAVSPQGAARLRLARELVEQADARRRQALAALLPSVEGGYSFRSFTFNLQALGFEGPLVPGLAFQPHIGPVDVSDVRAVASQSIFDLPAIRRHQASKALLASASGDAGAALNHTKGETAKAYLNALRAGAAVDTAQANIRLAERALQLARSQKEGGTGTGIDVTRAEAVVAEERQRLVSASLERSEAHLRLLHVINIGFDVELELTTRLVYVPAEIPEPARALEVARELRPEFKAQAAREEAARLNAAAVKWESLPSVAAFGDYGAIGWVGRSQLPTRTAGVSLRIPLWDGGRRDARRSESAALERQENIRSIETARQVELEIRLAIETLKSAEAQFSAAREVLTQAERELAQAERRMEAGVAAGLEITDAQARVARAREGLDLAIFRQRAARVGLGLAVGNVDMVLD